jgi:hypothetical protein
LQLTGHEGLKQSESDWIRERKAVSIIRACHIVVPFLRFIHISGTTGICIWPIMRGTGLMGQGQYLTILNHPENQLDSYDQEESGQPYRAVTTRRDDHLLNRLYFTRGLPNTQAALSTGSKSRFVPAARTQSTP